MVAKVEPLNDLTIRTLIENYKDSGQGGVIALNGKLNVRPAYQREFVYDADKRDRVMHSVYNGLPLNSIYWALNPDNTMEVIDGQQRIISICQFITNDDGSGADTGTQGNPIAINFNGKMNQTFSGLSPEKQKEILDYKLNVYVCSGTDDEKLEWFHTINIAGEPMTDQELLNADYTGTWLSDAKYYFSKKKNNPAINRAFYNNRERDTLLNITGEGANRQELLELVLRWVTNTDITQYNKEKRVFPSVAQYMGIHRADVNASELKNYYNSIIDWAKEIFPTYRKEMKGLEWGLLYNKYKNNKYNPVKLESELIRLFDIYDDDPDGLKKSGFYEYILSGNRSLIWHRIFSEKQQNQAYINQGKKCDKCGKPFDIKGLEAHHKIAFGDGGETTITNCQMLCHDCHADITARQNRE